MGKIMREVVVEREGSDGSSEAEGEVGITLGSWASREDLVEHQRR